MIDTTGGTDDTIDRARLGSWINPQHLEPEAIKRHRHAFTSHPARLLVIEDFLVPGVADKLARFLAGEVQYRKEYGLSSVEEAVDEDAWSSAPDDDRVFRLSRLEGPLPEFAMSPNALAYLRFRQTFMRPELLRYFEAVTGLALGPSDDFGVHRMEQGDYLRPHSDDNKNRRLALVLYLSPDWKPEFGGTLLVDNDEGRVAQVDPDYNSIVMFDVLSGTSHQVAPVLPTTGDRARFTIGGWYHRPAGG